MSRFEVFETGEPLVYRVLVECSSGTYVRVLAADLGTRLDGAAHLRALRRTSVGSITDAEAIPLDSVDRSSIRPSVELVRDLPRVPVTGDLLEALRHGKILERASLQVAGDGPWAVVGPHGELVAVCELQSTDRVRPAVVLAPAG